MRVEAINIGPSEALGPVESVTAVAGKGLVGDRHYTDNPAPGNALTLIEAEVLEDVGLTGAQSRRQVVVRGVRLNDLIGKRFRVGDVECLGVEICEPCQHLQRMTRPGIIKDMLHRGGLNADIISGGTISVGDPISETPDLGFLVSHRLFAARHPVETPIRQEAARWHASREFRRTRPDPLSASSTSSCAGA